MFHNDFVDERGNLGDAVPLGERGLELAGPAQASAVVKHLTDGASHLCCGRGTGAQVDAAPKYSTRAATSGLSSVLPATTRARLRNQRALHGTVAAVGDHHVDVGE